MFIETSAFVAILLNDTEIDAVTSTIAKAKKRVTAAHIRLEVNMVVSTRLAISVAEADRRYQTILDEADIWIESLTDEISQRAVEAFNLYGKGRKSKAQLNFGDCLSYACAKHLGLPMLFVGNDFTHTDIRKA